MLKNIRNNWITEKTQTLDFKDPESETSVQAKWNNLKSLYKKESKNIIKNTNIDYRTIYPNNFEKQKVNLVLNVLMIKRLLP